MTLRPFPQRVHAFSATAAVHRFIHSSSLVFFSAFFVLGSPGLLSAQQPLDYATQIQPLFDASCGGATCHIGMRTNGVELTDYQSVVESVGETYGRLIVTPFSSTESPLFDKIANENPDNGARMPFGADPLAQESINVIARWIDEGAMTASEVLRGDANHDGSLNITDAIFFLVFLFRSGEAPYCEPIADANHDGSLNITDAIFFLVFLFREGQPPEALTADERDECNRPNSAPEAEPIGTVEGREGIALEFTIAASDPDDRDDLSFAPEEVPDGLQVGRDTGLVTWIPRFGQAGDHRIRIRVTDNGRPPLSAETTGLIRVLEGNHPPEIGELGTLYGREEVPLSFFYVVADLEGGTLRYELLAGPAGSTLNSQTGLFGWTPARGQAGEHLIRMRVTDDGEPPQSTDGQVTVIVVDADSPINQPPFTPSHGVYRTYPGFPIELPIGATDPDGNRLTYSAEKLPVGASLDERTGVLQWTPSDDQLGVFYIPCTVTDDGVPPESIEATLVFQVLPPDPCSEPVCDPATGCEAILLTSFDESCCTGDNEPTVRVAEPVAGCPEGRVLHVGRNKRGFGRLQNCDRLQVEAFGQGGFSVRLNLEARCINEEQLVSLRVRLETADQVIFDIEGGRFNRAFQLREDGYSQAFALFFTWRDIPTAAFDDKEALLSVTLSDFGGEVLERTLRLFLTLSFLDDLPEAGVVDVKAGEVGCVGCHRPLGPTGEREGIEDPHPWFGLSCVDCHGGDPEASTRAEAHVAAFGDDGNNTRFLRNLATDQLDAVREEYIQFVNPGDFRVAARGCGALNPAEFDPDPRFGCHQQIVESVPLSVMATYAGHYDLPRYLAGSQEKEAAVFAAVDVADPGFNPDTMPEGAIASLGALREPDPLADRATVGTCMDVYLPKACPTCHLSDFGPNDAAGNYRSSGCTACHMLYEEDGLSRSLDPVISKDFPPHPRTHTLTTAITTDQCSRCHFQGGRIGLAFQGIREGGFAAENTPPNGVTLGRDLHAHDPDYYFSDEDDTNDIDETPPDVHFSAGMACMDCHVGGDVHGDGNLYISERYQVGVRCEDCHGTVRAEIDEDPADGLFKNSKGFPFRRIRRAEDNRILLRLATEDRELEIPQIHRVLGSGINDAMVEAMGVNGRGFSHTDRLECYSCHTSWRQTCFGCHVTIDDTGTARNSTTGKDSLGAVSVTRDNYSLDFYALGTNERGKITPLCSSMSVFMTYVDAEGVTRFRDRIRTSSEGKRGFGWNPFHHHTVSRVPQNCDRCHPVAPDAGPDNSATLRETYGFGNGKFVTADGDGVLHDLSAFLDESGELISDFPHPNTGPVPAVTRQKAMSIQVVPQSRSQ